MHSNVILSIFTYIRRLTVSICRLNRQEQARTMILPSTARMVVRMFLFLLMTFVVAISTTPATTVKNDTTATVIPRDAVGVGILSLNRTTQISPPNAKSENNVSVLATSTTSSSTHWAFSFMNSKQYPPGLHLNQPQVNQYTPDVSQDARNMTDIDYLQNEQAVSLNRELSHFNVSEYLFVPDLFRGLLQAGKTQDNYPFSHKCGQDLAMYHLAWSRNETWAWSVYDSMGSRRPGLLNGMMTWSGSLEQCLNTQVNGGRLGHNASSAPVWTHFCSVFMTPPRWLKERMRSFKIPFPVAAPSFIIDVCAMSGCSEWDLHGLFQKYVSENFWRENLTITNVRCYKEKQLWEDIPAVLSLFIIFLLLLLAFAGTIYEIIIRARRDGVKCSIDIHIGLNLNSAANPVLAETGDLNKLESTSYTNHGTSDAPSGSIPNSTDHALTQGTNNESSLDIGIMRSDVESSLKSSADVPVGVSEEQGQDSGSVLRPNEVKTKKSVKHFDLETAAGQNENGASDLGNTANRSDTLSGANNTANRSDALSGANNTARKIPSVAASTNSNKKRPSRVFTSSFKSMLSSGSLFRRKSLPRIKRRHLPTHLSFTETKKTSMSTVTLLQRLLVTFSIRRNMTNVFAKGHTDMLFCLNGIRVLGNSWIVMGSYFMMLYTNPPVVENHLTLSRFGQSIWGQFLINTSLSADTFFVISGALNVYNLMKAKAKNGCRNMLQVMSPAEYVWGVVHRLVRILPCYYVALMIHANLSGYLATERELRQQGDSTASCRDNWWANVLFISNFYKADQMCMPWSYYLVIDLQLSILSPLVTIPLVCRPILGFILLVCLLGIQIVSVMIVNTGINGNSMRVSTTSYFSDIYVKPYCRAGVYAIGMGLGYFLYSGDKKIRLRKVPLCAGWLLCLTALLLLPQITYLQYQEGGRLWSGFETSLYEALSRPTWGLAMSWVIFTCCNSQGGLISKCLSWNVFIPIARITYAVYVLHPILMEAVLVSTHTSTRVSFENMTLGYISLVAGSWCLAICMILLVEQPFVQMEAVINRHIHKKKT